MRGAAYGARSGERMPAAAAWRFTSAQNAWRVIGPPRAVTKSASDLRPASNSGRASRT